ncbi:hypothetical protein ABIA33_006718 [Streptacidiphilus sp. MAP12-16]|jgi:hypothetical protein
MAARAIAAVEDVDAQFFQPVSLDDAVALLGHPAQPAP